MRTIVMVGLLLTALALQSAHAGDLVVVMSAKSDVDRLTQDDVTNIFLGRYRQLPNGAVAQPIDMPPGTAEKAMFYRRLVGKELTEINAYWSRLIFSGRTKPPQIVKSPDEVTSELLQNPGAIAYLQRSQVDRRLRVVLDLGGSP